MQVYIILFSLVSNLLQFTLEKESKSKTNDHWIVLGHSPKKIRNSVNYINLKVILKNIM